MWTVSHRTLKLLAALIWYIGVFILLTKGGELAKEAQSLHPLGNAKYISIAAGILIGIIKTKYIFIKSCRKNLARINALTNPRLWQFYRPQFFIALGLMILLGATLSRVSHGNYGALIAVSILDVSIGTALLLSSWEFWKVLVPFRVK